MIRINAIGEPCPVPVVKSLKAIEELNGAGTVETLVDNEIAVENLTKMATNKGYDVTVAKLPNHEFKVTINTCKEAEGSSEAPADVNENIASNENRISNKNRVVVISSDKMGEGNDDLGKVLIKGFLYALSQLEALPNTLIFYNGGAVFTCEGSSSLEDLSSMEEKGVEILTCGTCLDYYGLTQKLKVGQVTNMYVIAERMSQADLIIKP
ncbi:sulfurtransferase-like selenium metabolism protein YedF [Alloiococcus sp. CFN-8]|uniref:sulfurtransferase-like selenium metabolism protein YedF n=1 Tax=Alloiococcus sp. CFN-8 TaxID=3416081 RepID=UPI003CF89AC6